MFLTYRYRLLPTKPQHRALEGILESQRQLYNAALQERIEAYRKAGLSRTLIDQQKALTEWRKSDLEARAVPVNIQRQTLKRLDDAYRAFFRRLRQGDKPGFPRFRGEGWFHAFGFREFDGITLRENRLRFRGLPGALRVHSHRPMPAEGIIKSCIIRRDTKGWTVGFAMELPTPEPRGGDRAVGIDVGLTHFATLSDGGVIPSLRAARRVERRLRIVQRALSRKHKGSVGRAKARLRVRRCHAAIANRRDNYLHQSTARLVRDYDIIAVESLNVGALARSALRKEVHDAGWGKFFSMLRYKAARAGILLVEVNPKNTSQDCSNCGTKVPKRLEDRVHACACGLSIDRDLNAARNILSRAGVGPGLRNVAGCGMRAGANLSCQSGVEDSPAVN